MTEDRGRMTEAFEFGIGNGRAEGLNAEVGMRPPAVGAIGAYAPQGIWNDGIAAHRLLIVLKTILTFLTV